MSASQFKHLFPIYAQHDCGNANANTDANANAVPTFSKSEGAKSFTGGKEGDNNLSAITQKPFVYFDNAATSQRLDSSLASMSDYYTQFNANVHRGNYASAKTASEAYEKARLIMANFLGVSEKAESVIFTSGTTSSINIIANGLTASMLKGSKILVCESEHHANFLPWQSLAQRFNLEMIPVSLGERGEFKQNHLSELLNTMNDEIALIAIAHVSNALGTVYPIETISKKAKQHGIITVIDGTQAAAHLNIDVDLIGCDFYAISGHKMFGPTGIGCFYGRFDLLTAMQASKLGGEMIKDVSWDSYSTQPPPLKFEAGTPNIAGVIGMASAADFIKNNINTIQAYEQELFTSLLSAIKEIKAIDVYGNHNITSSISKQVTYCNDDDLVANFEDESGLQSDAQGLIDQTIPLLSFNVKGIHPQDIASYLSKEGVAVRSGHHCAMPLMKKMGVSGTVRVSLSCYNDIQEIHYFLSALKACIKLHFGSESSAKNTEAKYNGGPHISTGNKVFANDIDVLPYAKQVKKLRSWNEKHRFLLLNSKTLSAMPDTQICSRNEVFGCEAQVWLYRNADEHLFAHSNSKVVRGLLVLLTEKVNSMPDKLKQDFKLLEYYSELGLSQFFSQGRRDGMLAIEKKLNELY